MAVLLLGLTGCGGPDASNVEWDEYATDWQVEIEQAIADEDCAALADHFQLANEGNDAHAARYGSNNAALMDYIAESSEEVGCGHP